MNVSFKNQILLTLYTVVLLILFTGSLSAVKVIPLGEVNRPISIHADDACIYIVEFPGVYIYSSENFKLVKKFGKRGEGPDLNKIKDIHQGDYWFQNLTQSKKNSLPLYIQFPQFHVYDNKIFLKGLEEDFVINVFNASGQKLYSIDREYKKIKMTEADKKRYLDYFKTSRIFGRAFDQMKSRLEFPVYFPALQTFAVADGNIYAITYGKKNGKTEILVLDLKGKLLRTAFLPYHQRDDELAMTLENRVSRQVTNSTFAIKNGKFYQLLENQDKESWELHIYEIK